MKQLMYITTIIFLFIITTTSGYSVSELTQSNPNTQYQASKNIILELTSQNIEELNNCKIKINQNPTLKLSNNQEEITISTIISTNKINLPIYISPTTQTQTYPLELVTTCNNNQQLHIIDINIYNTPMLMINLRKENIPFDKTNQELTLPIMISNLGLGNINNLKINIENSDFYLVEEPPYKIEQLPANSNKNINLTISTNTPIELKEYKLNLEITYQDDTLNRTTKHQSIYFFIGDKISLEKKPNNDLKTQTNTTSNKQNTSTSYLSSNLTAYLALALIIILTLFIIVWLLW